MRLQLPRIPPYYYVSEIHHGIENINVTLLDVPDSQEAAHAVWAFVIATFEGIAHPFGRTSEFQLDEAVAVATAAMEGAAVTPTALEAVSLSFGIEGVSRTCTHQLVRSRVGAGFGQHSMRATPATEFNLRLPATFMDSLPDDELQAYIDSVDHLRRFYDLLLDRGIPYQDARFVLPEAVETHIVAAYNLLALRGVIGRRICNRMAWEINTVARYMHDLTVRALPWVGRSLRARCERTGVCQTLDPMFEATCMYWSNEVNSIQYCADAPALAGATFSYDRWKNGNVLHWDDVDRDRLRIEADHPNVVVSMIDGRTILAERRAGEWEATRG